MSYLIAQLLVPLLVTLFCGILAGAGLVSWWQDRSGASPKAEAIAQQRHVHTLQGRIDKLQRSRRTLEQQGREMEAQLARALSDGDRARQDRDDHKSTLAALAGSHESELEQLRQAQRDTEARLASEIRRYDTMLAELRAENQRLSDRQGASVTEQDSVLRALRGTNERLEAELLQARQDLDASAVLIQRTQAEADQRHASARRRYAELEVEVARLVEELRSTRRSLDGLRQTAAAQEDVAGSLEASEQRRVEIEAKLAALQAASHAGPAPATEEIAAVAHVVTETDSLSLQDAIRARAYDIWVAEGQPRGRSSEIWSRAEAEISRDRGVEI